MEYRGDRLGGGAPNTAYRRTTIGNTRLSAHKVLNFKAEAGHIYIAQGLVMFDNWATAWLKDERK